ncbi:MAG: ABC transporter ATP-binding protein [Acidimicrobiia bacterium]
MSAVEVEGLVVRYGEVIAVDGLSFTAEPGRVTALVGPNGAGKTSTVEVLEGYRAPAAGRVAVVGLDPRRDHAALTERIGVMLQSGGVHTGIRPLEALRHAAALYRDPLDPVELLARVGLAGRERRTWRQLSGGEQRRLALALALVGRPEVAFLDEPTAGVDPHGRREVREVVAELRERGTAVVLTSHEVDEVERVADHVVVVHRGRVRAAGTPDELVRRAGVDQVRFAAPPRLDVGGLGRHLAPPGTGTPTPVRVVEEGPGRYLVEAPPSPAVVAALTAWLAAHDVALSDLQVGRQRLEDVVVELTRDAPPTGAEPRPGPADDR